MACAGERELFHRHFTDVRTHAQLTGLRWEGEECSMAIAAMFSEPDRARETVARIDPQTGNISAAKALVSNCPEWVLEHLSATLDSSATRPLRDGYSAIVREICKRRPDLNHLIAWDALNTLADTSVDDLIERSLLLSLGPLHANAVSLLNDSLRRTPLISDSVARAQALVALDEDVRDLIQKSTPETVSDDMLKRAADIARAVQQRSERNQLLRTIAVSYFRLGMKETGAKIEVEAGGGPLVLYDPDDDVQKQVIGSSKKGDINRAFALRRSDAYFQQALDRKDWNVALASIRESEFSRADADALSRLSSEAKIRRPEGNDEIRLKNLERIRQRAEDEAEPELSVPLSSFAGCLLTARRRTSRRCSYRQSLMRRVSRRLMDSCVPSPKFSKRPSTPKRKTLPTNANANCS